ncbi:MAG TPA: S1/P1 nuclease [Xanthobacteraceae bacterium]|jgi:hypothetical protein|nr:S1/P1 nuclease [Xanthobacteraceae bacterium]
MKLSVVVAGVLLIFAAPQNALAWGDDGHETVALIAQQCLAPAVKAKVTSMLAADTDNLTKHDIASEATWADKYREASQANYDATQNWHFTDMELNGPNLTTACFGRNPLPSGTLASKGPPKACAVDKIEQFQKELAAPNIDAEERLIALKFLLHFVGDLHQPLHSSDNNDRGGNDIKVVVDGFAHTKKDELHGYWDTQFVDGIAKPPATLAQMLLAQLTAADAASWATGTPEDWQMEAFNIARKDAYGNPPPSKTAPDHLDANYVKTAEADASLQIERAGIRLAYILNTSLGSDDTDWASCLQGQSAPVVKTHRTSRTKH